MTISLKNVASRQLSLGVSFSVTKNIFGYWYGLTPGLRLSLKQHLQLIQGPSLDITIEEVGKEAFSDADHEEVQYAIQFARNVFAQVGMGVRRIEWWYVPKRYAEEGDYYYIDGESDCLHLINDIHGPKGTIDVFVVKGMYSAGWSPVNGDEDCTKRERTGCIVLISGSKDFTGNTVAHEIGHFLGLDHCEDDSKCTGADNFINSSSGSNRGILPHQGEKMKKHCHVTR